MLTLHTFSVHQNEPCMYSSSGQIRNKIGHSIAVVGKNVQW